MGPINDVVLDAGSAPKSENVPIQVTSIRLTKDNYLSWSAALEIGITSCGRLSYITGDKPAPSKSDPQWATWALDDSQVKVWIISSVSSDIQPLILRKPTSFDMWTVLAKMYGRKKMHLRTYQIKRNIYSLKQGDLSVAAFYAALKTKWEELDYHVNDEWNCDSDHSLYWEKEWMDRTFLFLGGMRDEFESIRSQILNGDEIPGIEEVYTRVESEEQRRQVMHLDTSHGNAPSAFVSRASGTAQRPARRCTHCNKLGHSVDFCWDIHPEKRLVRGRPPSGRRSPSVFDSSQSNLSNVTARRNPPSAFCVGRNWGQVMDFCSPFLSSETVGDNFHSDNFHSNWVGEGPTAFPSLYRLEIKSSVGVLLLTLLHTEEGQRGRIPLWFCLPLENAGSLTAGRT
ncbi:hypothetical protein EJ110_NYTH24410 [Nymphaea thermarum]|nr:hypothetical protein EJ110_NYTH24410 [Nymphaea thermarum]